jgi:hypothetical protein
MPEEVQPAPAAPPAPPTLPGSPPFAPPNPEPVMANVRDPESLVSQPVADPGSVPPSKSKSALVSVLIGLLVGLLILALVFGAYFLIKGDKLNLSRSTTNIEPLPDEREMISPGETEAEVTVIDEVTCVAEESGNAMSLEEAMMLAEESDCLTGGKLTGDSSCNSTTGTWWLDLDFNQEGCDPACVVNVDTGESEINWRCTGLEINKEESTGTGNLGIKDELE